MRKMYSMVAAAGMMLALVPLSAMAYSELSYNNTIKPQYEKQVRHRYEQVYSYGKPVDIPPLNTKVRGIWGFAGDNESDGYFGGILTRSHRFGVFRGLFNTTDNETRGKIVGILKHGYLDGRVITADQNVSPVTGLYKVDKETHVIKLRWMTPFTSGWAVAKISRSA
jgi:hypothetical protein